MQSRETQHQTPSTHHNLPTLTTLPHPVLLRLPGRLTRVLGLGSGVKGALPPNNSGTIVTVAFSSGFRAAEARPSEPSPGLSRLDAGTGFRRMDSVCEMCGAAWGVVLGVEGVWRPAVSGVLRLEGLLIVGMGGGVPEVEHGVWAPSSGGVWPWQSVWRLSKEREGEMRVSARELGAFGAALSSLASLSLGLLAVPGAGVKVPPGESPRPLFSVDPLVPSITFLSLSASSTDSRPLFLGCLSSEEAAVLISSAKTSVQETWKRPADQKKTPDPVQTNSRGFLGMQDMFSYRIAPPKTQSRTPAPTLSSHAYDPTRALAPTSGFTTSSGPSAWSNDFRCLVA